MPLTNTALRTLKGRDKPYKISDGGGLFVLVNPDGKRFWRLAYRYRGKQKTLAFGVYPTVSLAAARQGREAAKAQLAQGIDPSQTRQLEKRAAKTATQNSFEAVAREWHEKQSTRLTTKYARLVLRRLELDIFPHLGVRPIADIDAPELLDVLRKVEARSALDIAKRLRESCGQVSRYAIITGRANRDPAADLKGALQGAPRVRHHKAISRGELAGLLLALDTYDGEPITRLALKLIILTFVRTSELRGAEWCEFEGLDGDSPLWRIPATRMKTRRVHLVPLSRQAVTLLSVLRPLTGRSNYLFPSSGREGFMSNNTMLYALYRMGYHSRATVHGFRSVASTLLNEAGFNSNWIERQLAHDERDRVGAAYNAAQYLADRCQMMQWWANHLDDLPHEEAGRSGRFENLTSCTKAFEQRTRDRIASQASQCELKRL
jgi:integrase